MTDKAAKPLALAAVLVLGLAGLAQAQTRTPWQEPGPARGTEAPAQQAQAEAPREDAAPRPRPRPEKRQARRPDPDAAPRRGRAERRVAGSHRRPQGYRAARYPGGGGAAWRTGQDAYGFMGSYGGCSFRGHAGPYGFSLDHRC